MLAAHRVGGDAGRGVQDPGTRVSEVESRPARVARVGVAEGESRIERMARAQPWAAPGEVVHNQVGPPAWACVSATQVDGIRQIASDIITVNGPASVLPG